MDSVWSLSGNQGDKWNPAQVAVNDQTASYQYVIEGVRGKDIKGDIAIDDISLMVSCLSGENQTTKPTTFTVSTTPASSPSLTSSEGK
ncbi:MAM domain-containing glycosylphosphatidylinositol anchor 2-like [Paramuricea clavata]|uniref:MAM domain-containing glycosylphosphatidylinositol anchor 2-like n=1 Tax=Paramuricea clavata TaxID=317549 RepID=A0A7D9EBZ1_PARCT|nr:MAM domain-containing glycosylphosphatidylinositol anchor 2-like [Paramuricea clavata]